MPDEHDDDDHDVITAEASTATVTTGPAETGLYANPTDHIDRPVNAKPTPNTTPAEDTEPTPKVFPTVTTATSAAATATAPAVPSSTDNFLPHYFPTFGVSKRTQIWIYGALAIIVLFCAGLGTYFYVQRRKRIRNSRDDYEFDVLDDEDATTGANGGGKGRRVKKRAGELYDAFAGESDEELLSDGESQYKDVEEDGDDDNEKNRGRSQSREHDERR